MNFPSRLNIAFIFAGALAALFFIDPNLGSFNTDFSSFFPAFTLLSSLFSVIFFVISPHYILQKQLLSNFTHSSKDEKEILELKISTSRSPDFKKTLERTYGNLFLLCLMVSIIVLEILKFLLKIINLFPTQGEYLENNWGILQIVISNAVIWVGNLLLRLFSITEISLINQEAYNVLFIFVVVICIILAFLTESSYRTMRNRLDWFSYYVYFQKYSFFIDSLYRKDPDTIRHQKKLQKFRETISVNWAKTKEQFDAIRLDIARDCGKLLESLELDLETYRQYSENLKADFVKGPENEITKPLRERVEHFFSITKITTTNQAFESLKLIGILPLIKKDDRKKFLDMSDKIQELRVHQNITFAKWELWKNNIFTAIRRHQDYFLEKFQDTKAFMKEYFNQYPEKKKEYEELDKFTFETDKHFIRGYDDGFTFKDLTEKTLELHKETLVGLSELENHVNTIKSIKNHLMPKGEEKLVLFSIYSR